MPAHDPSAVDVDHEARSHLPTPGRSVRDHLVGFSAALVFPILLFSAFLLWQIATRERARLEFEAGDIARDIAVAIDREMTGLLSSLDVLSTSAYLKRRDLSGFAGQATDLLNRQGIVLVLSDANGQQLYNARLPVGTDLPQTNLPWDKAAIESGRAYVTDLFTGQVSGQPLFAAVRSVLGEDGKPVYVLNFSLPVERLQAIIREANTSPSYTVAIVDRSGKIMARSSRHEDFVGRPASQDLQDNTRGQEGSWSGTTVDGVPVLGAYARSKLTGFRAAVGIRYGDLNEPLWRSLSVFLALGTCVAGLSAMLAWYLGKRIASPIGALAGRAAALGRGETVEPLSSGLMEANVVAAELSAASESRREREAELKDANDELQRFAYIVSHDLRSPLVNIMGFTSELEALRQDIFRRIEALRPPDDPATRQDEALGADVDEAIGFIKASIAKMDRLINAILRLSREGRREFNPERIDMTAMLEGIAKSAAHQAEEAEADLVIGRLPALQSDRVALEQIFSNLVDNALKYLRRDVKGRVEVTGRAVAGGVVYEVRDNGRGIEERDRERVFDLFRRSGVQDRPGEGIGLAHVRALVRRLGGTIHLTSELGQGSTFTIALPRRWPGERKGEVR